MLNAGGILSRFLRNLAIIIIIIIIIIDFLPDLWYGSFVVGPQLVGAWDFQFGGL